MARLVGYQRLHSNPTGEFYKILRKCGEIDFTEDYFGLDELKIILAIVVLFNLIVIQRMSRQYSCIVYFSRLST